MKKLITNYQFDSTNKTVKLLDYSSVSLENILLITNVSSNTILYNFASPGFGADVTGNTITLDYDTTSMLNTDVLQIFYEDLEESPATEETLSLFRRILRVLQSNATVDSADRQIVRVATVDGGNINITGINGGNITTVQNANVNGFNSVDTRYLLMDESRNAYANHVRRNLIF